MSKQMERLFDMLQYLNNGAQGDFLLQTSKGNKKVPAKQVQAFTATKIHEFLLAGGTELPGTKKAIQAFTGTTDVSKITTSVWNALQEEPNFDTLWQQAFRSVPLRKGQLEWQIGTVTSGTALKLLEEGEKVEYAGIEGSSVKGEVELYGSGLLLSWKTMEGRDLAGFFNAMVDFRNKRMNEYANVHYGLLATAAENEKIAWSAGTTVLDRDIKTLNEGYNTIGDACKDFGMGDTANSRMILFVSPRLRQRLNQAIRVTSSDMAREGGDTVDSNIDLMFTYNSAIPANKGVMVLPGNKIQNSVYMQEKTFERQDPDNLNWLKSSFTAFGAVVGENAQTAELSFA